MTLAQVREQRFAARRKLTAGTDPVPERKAIAEAKHRENEARERENENSFENIARKCGNGGLRASLRITPITSYGAWRATFSCVWS